MISFVYLDVGGVVIDDFSGNNKWQELQHELGIEASKAKDFKKLWKQYESELCIGRDVETLVPILAKELGLRLPKDYSLLTGLVSRFYANPGIWPIIERLKLQTPVGLLTNMYPRMFAAIEQAHILPDIQWDVVVDSSLERLQKPDRKLFELAEKKAAVPHHEILFVDNTLEHIQAAKAFGWQTLLYNASNHQAAVQELDEFLEAKLNY